MEENKKNKVLVTGANGFIGKHLCSVLADTWQVRGVVRKKPTINLPKGVETFYVENIGSETDWSDALEGVNAIVHLAARVHIMAEGSSDPLSDYRLVNVSGTERLARAAAETGIKRFIYISSIKVNGEKTTKDPFSPESIPAPEDPYGQSKWEAEQALYRVAEESGMEVVILRPPLVYGPGVRANFLKLMKLVDRGIPLPLGAIHNQRSMLYIGNLVDAIVVCLNNPQAAGETLLVCDGKDISTPELIRMIAGAMGRNACLFNIHSVMLKVLGMITGKMHEIDRLSSSLRIDGSELVQTLGWKPPFSMEEGIRKTVNWFIEQK